MNISRNESSRIQHRNTDLQVIGGPATHLSLSVVTAIHSCEHERLQFWRNGRGVCGDQEAKCGSCKSIACSFPLIILSDADYNSYQNEDPDNFENWEKLVRAAETLEGGLNRNSSPQAIATTRDSYDRFLAKFPLLFGYWKKYADLEFSIAGTEAAEMVRL